MRGRVLVVAWLLSALFVFVLLGTGVGALWVVGGLVILAWGLAVATNYRGAADAMPTRTGFGPFRQETSTAMFRLIFGLFALWGLGLLIAGVTRL